MSVRPSRLPAALLAGALTTVVLAGCAGTPPQVAGASAPASSTAAATGAADQRIEVQVSGGRVHGDTGRVPVAAGSHVTLVVTSDVADEVHVHGYDLMGDVAPGQPVTIAFKATAPGRFEIELEQRGVQIGELTVEP